MADLILYSYWRSSCSYRARIALYHKNLDFDYRSVHLVRDGGEQHRAEYLGLNPMGQVPCLVHDGHSIAQSMVIFEYLDRVFPASPLFPGETWERARVQQFCEMVNSGIQPVQNLAVLKELNTRFGADDEAKADWVVFWIDKGFHALEKLVAQTAGRYCFGDEITAADAFLVPQVYNAERFGIKMERFPVLRRIHEACIALPAFQKAEPSVQPDAP